MTSTATLTAREECILFVATYSTPNTRRAVELAQAGRITWEQVRDLVAKSLLAGLEATA